MLEISVNQLEKKFAGKKILDDISFQVYRGEHVGIIGQNGAGKTTLFKILSGATDYDSGIVTIAKNHKPGLIDQIPVFPSQYTVKDVLETAFLPLQQIQSNIKQLTHLMESDTSDALLHQYSENIAAFEAAGGYDAPHRLEALCDDWRMSSAFLNQPFVSLSGGEKTKINLARLLLENTDILLLDEPTNHLDIYTTEWLEKYLSQFKGAVLTISHDRYFLDRVTTRIIELENGKAEFYSGNYSFFAEEKERRYQTQLATYHKEQAKIKQLEAASEKLRLWAFKGMDKTYKRAISMEKRIERIKQTKKPAKEKAMKANFSEVQFRGDKMLTLEKINKSFQSERLFSNVNLQIKGGERIAFLGKNGAGKSTLLKIILGEEKADSGTIKIGPAVKIGYLPQIITFSDPNQTILDYMTADRKFNYQQARDRLAAFRFKQDDVYKSLNSLSGGERTRLTLSRLMDDAVNLLILDEPTNHLDINSREWIESALSSFTGTILFVSHDRYFIDRFATQIWELNKNGITVFDGDYSEYQAIKESEYANVSSTPGLLNKTITEPKKGLRDNEKNTKENSSVKAHKTHSSSSNKRLDKQISSIEQNISKLEQQQAMLQTQLTSIGDNYEKIQAIYPMIEETEKKLTQLYEEWELLESQR